MFGLFNKTPKKPSVTPEDKKWIEDSLIGYIEQFGIEHLSEKPFLLPNKETFPYSDLNDEKQFEGLYKQICSVFVLEPEEIDLLIYDDVKSKTWFHGTGFSAHIKKGDPLGIYVKNHLKDEKEYKVYIAKSNFNNTWSLIATLSHELAHVKLLGKKYMPENRDDMEPLTDLACIFFGFGIYLANSVIAKDIYWISKQGYLPNEMISYSNALLCFITGKNAQDYADYFNENTRNIFLKDYSYLVNTEDTILDREKVSHCNKVFKLWNIIDEAFDKENYPLVVETCNGLIFNEEKDIFALNSIGYAKLMMKEYADAMDDFTKAIDINPYFEYPYNNRGYCKLLLGDIDNAYFDISSSLDMNPENSYAWRNMALYYYKRGDYQNALEHFLKAEEIDKETELINYCLSKTYKILSDNDKSEEYLKKSMELKEKIEEIDQLLT